MIVRDDIPKAVQLVADTLEDAGFEAYLVGGCVRDLLLQRTPKDWDITTNATPTEIQALWAKDETFCNNDYGTVGIKTTEADKNGGDECIKVVEVTPYRAEGTYTDSRRPDSVTFGVSLEEDLARRDFTVNAIAYRPRDEMLVDVFDGIADVEKKRLKTVGTAVDRFTEDALRMMRVVRLAAELNFTIEAETMAAIAEHHALLEKISNERIRDEFIRIIESPAPMLGIAFLERLGLLQHIIPELRESIGCEQGGIHAYDVFEHLLRTLQAAADKGYDTELRLAALFHDIAKPATRRTGGKTKKYTFFGHEVIGARMTRKILTRLKFPHDVVDTVEKLVRWHMFFADPDEITHTAVRRTIARIGEERIDDLLHLRVCDRIGTGRPKEQPFRFRKYKAMVDEVRRDPVSPKMLAITGDDILKHTGESPGPRIGYMLHALLEEVLKDPTKNTRRVLLSRVETLTTLNEEKLKARADAGKERLKAEEADALQQIACKHKVG